MRVLKGLKSKMCLMAGADTAVTGTVTAGKNTSSGTTRGAAFAAGDLVSRAATPSSPNCTFTMLMGS